MSKKYIGGIAIALALAVPLAVKFKSPGRKVEVSTVEVKTGEIHPSIIASGNLTYRREVQLTSEVIGKVSEILVKEGDEVKKGQVVLRLDPISYRAEVAQQEANEKISKVSIEKARLSLQNEERNLQRTKTLAAEKFIQATKLDDAVNQVDIAKVELESAQENLAQARALLAEIKVKLAKTEIRSPINGTVTSIQIKVGETAIVSVTGIAGSNLITIADLDSLMAEITVDEADIGHIAVGQQASVFPAAFSQEPITAAVENISMTPKVSTQGRGYLVKLKLSKMSQELRTGMTCRAEIITGQGGSRTIAPLQAIFTEDRSDEKKNESYVFVVENGIARKKHVELGVADDNNQEVIRGLQMGALVITGPARTLHDLHDGDLVSNMPFTKASEARL